VEQQYLPWFRRRRAVFARLMTLCLSVIEPALRFTMLLLSTALKQRLEYIITPAVASFATLNGSYLTEALDCLGPRRKRAVKPASDRVP
jgi:hypothetical protein